MYESEEQLTANEKLALGFWFFEMPTPYQDDVCIQLLRITQEKKLIHTKETESIFSSLQSISHYEHVGTNTQLIWSHHSWTSSFS